MLKEVSLLPIGAYDGARVLALRDAHGGRVPAPLAVRRSDIQVLPQRRLYIAPGRLGLPMARRRHLCPPGACCDVCGREPQPRYDSRRKRTHLGLAQVERAEGGGYLAMLAGRRVGHFATVMAATAAVEAQLSAHRPTLTRWAPTRRRRRESQLVRKGQEGSELTVVAARVVRRSL